MSRQTTPQVQIARDLRSILHLRAALRVEAWNHYADHDMPGGAALVMLGPAANLAAWEIRLYEAERAFYADDTGAATWPPVDDQDSDPLPLALVLTQWHDILREELGTPLGKAPTVEAAASYIGASVTWMFDTNEFGDVNFMAADHLAADLRDLVRRLEGVLHAGIREDRGVPCMNCAADLVKVWADKDHGEEYDRWHCRPCDEWSTPEQYALALRADYLRHATELSATDMERQHRVRPALLRMWAGRGQVRKRKAHEGARTLYDVGDTLAMRDQAATA